MPQGMFQGIGDCQNRYSPLGNSLGTGQKVAYMRPARQRMTGSEQEQMDQLKLAALDQEDLQVLSAHLQDAVITIADIRYLPKEQKAVFVLNRKTVPPSKVKVLVPPPDATVTNLSGPSLNVLLAPS